MPVTCALHDMPIHCAISACKSPNPDPEVTNTSQLLLHTAQAYLHHELLSGCHSAELTPGRECNVWLSNVMLPSNIVNKGCGKKRQRIVPGNWQT